MSNTSNLLLNNQTTGTNSGTWGITLNANQSIIDARMGDRLSKAVGGSSNITVSATEAQSLMHTLTGVLTGNIKYILPAAQGGFWLIKNTTSGSFTLTVVNDVSGTGVVIPQGTQMLLFSEPAITTVSASLSYLVSATIGTLTLTNALAIASGGTAATTVSGARTSLGLAIGTDVQAHSTQLDTIAAYNTNGIWTQTAQGAYTGRTITAGSANVTVTNGNGVSGNPTLDVATASTSQSGVSELATTAETQTGTDTGRTITPAGLKGALGFSKEYESSNQTVTTDSTVALSHGLGAIPKLIQLELVCLSSGDSNYTSGYRVPIYWSGDNTSSKGVLVSYTSSLIQITMGSTLPSLMAFGGGTSTSFVINSARWAYVVRAWA